MKRQSVILVLFAAVVASLFFVGCEKEQPQVPAEPQAEYQYIINIDRQNNSNSSFAEIDKLMVSINDIQFTYWSRVYYGTRTACDAKAVVAFDSVLASIDNEAMCAGIVKSDYLKALLQRYDMQGLITIKGRKWDAQGVEDF